MILTVHLLTGAAIAAKVKNPFWGFLFAFLSNYLLDSLPHTEYSIENIREKRWKKSLFDFLKVSLDIFFGFMLILFFSKSSLLIFTGAFFAILPDGLTFLLFIFPNNKLLQKHFEFHKNAAHFFNNKKISNFWRVFCQMTVIIIAILLLR